MENELYLKAEEIKELLERDERIVLLNKLEKEMNDNQEVMALAYKKDMAAVNYSDTLNHYSEESKEAQLALKKLHEAKLKLDSHPLVREYLKAYSEVRNLYENINNILFSNFAPNLCHKESK